MIPGPPVNYQNTCAQKIGTYFHPSQSDCVGGGETTNDGKSNQYYYEVLNTVQFKVLRPFNGLCKQMSAPKIFCSTNAEDTHGRISPGLVREK